MYWLFIYIEYQRTPAKYQISIYELIYISFFQAHPLLFLGDLLREDSLGSKKVASFFSKSGMPRYLVDLLSTLEVDWIALSRGEQRSQTDYKAFNTIMVSKLIFIFENIIFSRC